MAYLISYFNGLSKSQEYHLHLYLGPILVECERTSVFGGVCQNFKAVVKKNSLVDFTSDSWANDYCMSW